jgi:hypothetical protein
MDRKRQAIIGEAALKAARDEGYKQGSARTQDAYYEKHYKELYDKVEAFEKASGLNIQYGWQKPDKIGEIVKILLDGNAPLKRILDTAKYNLSKTEDLKTEIEKQIKILESTMAGTTKDEREDEF